MDTGDFTYFIRLDELYKKSHSHIQHGSLLDIRDANRNPLDLIGTIDHPLRLGSYLVQVTFMIYRSLVASMILGTDI